MVNALGPDIKDVLAYSNYPAARAGAWRIAADMRFTGLDARLQADLADTSYEVAGAALHAYAVYDSAAALAAARRVLQQGSRGEQETTARWLVAKAGAAGDIRLLAKYTSGRSANSRRATIDAYASYLAAVTDSASFAETLQATDALLAEESIESNSLDLQMAVFEELKPFPAEEKRKMPWRKAMATDWLNAQLAAANGSDRQALQKMLDKKTLR